MIRVATRADAEQVLAIYGPLIESTVITFEIEVPSVGEIANRIEDVLKKWPWIVMQEGDQVVGYAYAHEQGQRKAYQWSVESSIYIAEGFRGMGVGRKLYSCLFAILKEQGFFNVVAGASLPNESSVRLHESMGFVHVGTFKNIGFKMGRWVDVARWQLELSPYQDSPDSPIWFEEFRQRMELEALLVP